VSVLASNRHMIHHVYGPGCQGGHRQIAESAHCVFCLSYDECFSRATFDPFLVCKASSGGFLSLEGTVSNLRRPWQVSSLHHVMRMAVKTAVLKAFPFRLLNMICLRHIQLCNLSSQSHCRGKNDSAECNAVGDLQVQKELGIKLHDPAETYIDMATTLIQQGIAKPVPK